MIGKDITFVYVANATFGNTKIESSKYLEKKD